MSNEPFHRCTHTAISPDGHLFVSDGYGNACVHKYTPDGRLAKSWGESGTGPGQFNIVHNITADDDGWIYVADRENHRVQVFDTEGRYEAQWNNLHRPCGLYMPRGSCPHCFIGELGPGMAVNRNHPNLGPRLSIVTNEGELVARLGGEDGPGQEARQVSWLRHGLAVGQPGRHLCGRGRLYQLAVELRGRTEAALAAYVAETRESVSAAHGPPTESHRDPHPRGPAGRVPHHGPRERLRPRKSSAAIRSAPSWRGRPSTAKAISTWSISPSGASSGWRRTAAGP